MTARKAKPVYREPSLDDLIANGLQYQPIQDQPTPEETQPRDRSLLRTAGDYGISALKGAIGVPEAAVGLADLATGGAAGQALEEIGFRPKDAKAYLDQQYSDQQKQAFQAVQQAEGLGGKFVAALQNPSVIAHSVTESLPAMGAGGVIGRGLMAAAPRVGGAIAAGAGEGIMGAGSAAEQIRQETPGGLLTAEQSGLALASGAATFAFGALGNKIAKSLGIADVDTMLVGAAQSAASSKGVVRRVLEGAVSEGLLEELPQSVSEQVLQNMALGKPLDEGVDQAAVLGTLSGAAMGGGANLMSGRVEPMVQPAPLPAPPAPPIAQTVGGLTGAAAAIQTAAPAKPAGALARAASTIPQGAPNVGTQDQAPGNEANAGIPSPGGAQLPPDGGVPAPGPVADGSMAPGAEGQAPAVEPDPVAEPAPVAPTFATYEDAEAYRKEQKARGTSIQALPVPDPGGQGFTLAIKGTPEYAEGEQIRKDRADAAKSAKSLPRQDVGEKDGWKNSNAQAARDTADRLGLTARIEELFAQGLTVAQVVNAMDADMASIPKEERTGIVVFTRATLGIPSQMADEGKDEFSQWKAKRDARLSPAPQALSGILDGDILNVKGEPFKIRLPAKRAADAAGAGFDVVKVQGGFVARKVSDVGAGAPAETVATGDGGQLGDNGSGSEPVGRPVPDSAAGAVGDAAGDVLADGQQDAPVRDGKPEPVAPLTAKGKAQPTTLGTKIDAKAGPGFTAKDVLPNVKNAAPAPAAQAEAAPVEAPAPAGSSAAPASVPAAGGTASVEADGVKAGGFDSVAWDKARAEIVKKSRDAGNTHLDTIPPYVESMRGKRIFYVHDPKVTGVIRTVDNRGNVHINWSDDYSAKKELASEVLDGKKTVMRSTIGTSDLKDYAVLPQGKAATHATPKPQPLAPTDEHAHRWFASEKSAKAFITRNKIEGTYQAGPITHEGKAAFGILPKFSKAVAPVAEKPEVKAESPSQEMISEAIRLDVRNPGAMNKEALSSAIEAAKKRQREEHARIKASIEAKDDAPKTATVNVPPTVSEAFTAQMQKQKGRITRLKNEAEKAGSLEDKKAAQLKVTAAEATLRKMRTSIFDAEDAAIKAVESGDAQAFAAHADLFPGAADEIAKLAGPAQKIVTPQIPKTPKPESGLGAKLAELNAELERQGAVQNANTRAQRDSIRKQIAEQDFPDTLKAVDGNIDVAEELNQAFKYAGEEPKAKTIERVLKKRGITPEYQARWTERLMDGQNDELDAETRSYEAKKNPTYSGEPKPEPKRDPAPAPKEEQAEKPTTKPTVSANTVFTADAAAAARAILKKKLGTLNSGIDPELLQAGITLAGYHIEAGARTFAAYAKAMIEDMGEGIKPYLKSFYMAVKFDPRAAGMDGMDSAASVEAVSLDSIETTAEKADTSGDTKDGNATQQLDSAGQGTLGGAPAEDVRAPGEAGQAGAGPDGSGRSDGGSDAGTADAGGNVGAGLGANPGKLPVPSGGKRAGAKNAKKPRVSGAPRTDAGDELFGPTGGITPEENHAPNAPPVPAPQIEAKDFIISDDLGLGEGGQKTKFKNNVAAIRLLADLESTGRLATPSEQEVLAKYVGWGGISQAFDPSNQDWVKEHAELKALMTPEEFDAAARSTRYAHYTSREIIQDGIYAALRRFGFTGGKTLEAGTGVGNFIGLMPADMRSAGRFTAIEREPFSSAIARQLYPLQNVQKADFTEFKGNDAYYDAAVGNPPFASDPQTDLSGRKHLSGLTLHNYFFAKAVDMLREGGILAQVVTNSFLDAKTDSARKYISDRTVFLGAIRLPNNAFSKNANTEVTTDLIFLQKRPDSEVGGKAAKADAKRWLGTSPYTGKNGKQVALNQYFIDNPHMMLGDFGAFGTMYRPDQAALVARAGQNTLEMLKEAVAKLPEAVYKSAAQTGSAAQVNAAIVALKNPPVQEAGYFIDGDKLMQRVTDLAGEPRGVQITPETMWTAKTKLGEAGFQRIKALAEMRGTVRALIAAEMADKADDMAAMRAKLNTQYDEYRDTHGLINDPSTLRVFDDDPDFPLLASLEHGYTPGIGPDAAKKQGIKPYKSTAKKGPIFTQRVVAAREQVRKVETPADALAVSMAERGKLDAAYIGELLGMEPDAVLRELSAGDKPLLFRDPASDEYVLRDAYLSGNVRAKLAQAKSAGMFTNIQALEAVQPPDVASHEIVARLGSPWVPLSVYEDFAKSLFGEDAQAKAAYVKLNSSFQIVINGASDVAMTNTWGTKEYPGDAMLSALMNNRSLKVIAKDNDGKTYTNVDATERANTKATEVKEKFNDWLFQDPDRSELLTKAYNETNNNYVTRVYDGANMTFPGKVPDAIIKFRRHQRNAIARIVQDRTALLDHVVGAGKTFTVISGAMELKRTGLARKPMVAVPNHLVKQWAADFYRLYPGANVLTATKKDFEKANRRKFLAKIATGDWDAVVIAHSSFGFIKPAPEFEAQFNQEQVAGIMQTIKAVEAGDGDKQSKKRTVKQLEGMKERLENRIKALRDKPMDDLLDFEQIGVDQLFVDEAHMFKNLMFSTKMQQVQGLGDAMGSQRAYDMYVKASQIFAKNGRGQGVVFATGTPVSNSLAEMYHMMRYLMPQQMKDLGFESFDAWANTYASVEQVWMQAPSGDGFKASNKMSNFVNTPELLKMFDQVSDTVTMDDIQKAYSEENAGAEFPLPKVKGGRRTPVSLDKSKAQDDYMGEIAKRARAIEQRKGPPQKGDDNILVVMGDARKAAMDIRLVDHSETERAKGGRIDRATDEVVARYKQYADHKGTQIVFSDLGTPLKTAKAELKEYQALQERIAAGTDEVAASAVLGNEQSLDIMEDVEAAQAELEAKGSDWLGAVNAAIRGFSVYDDFKKALVEKGIPADEIAFIHDYNTDDQKATLFRKVNAGQIRVLMGSTAKLGAGTNVQERLVAEHHLDVPWRPSDVEQREGRIIRQGNKLMDAIKDFEVEILAYVTKDTLDMRMWQVQENKLKMINQLRTRKISREIDNAFEDMELSAGEMQAAATGDINLLKEIQLRAEVKRLEQRKRSFDGQKNDLITRKRRAADRMARLPDELSKAKDQAKDAQAYLDDLKNDPVKFAMSIDGKDYTDSTEAQEYLRALVDKRENVIGEDGFPVKEGDGIKTRAAPIAININGEVIKNRATVADLFSEAAGDREPIKWEFNGTEYRRRAKLGTAIRQNIVDAIADEAVKPVGKIGAFDVAVEGQAGKDGEYVLELTLSKAGKVVLSNDFRVPPDHGKLPEQVIRVAENMIEGATQKARYLEADLERAKREAADLAKVPESGEWPDEHKLAAARKAHRDILALLKQKGVDKLADGSTNLAQTGNPAANETDVVFATGAPVAPGQGISLKSAQNIASKVLNDLGIGSIVKLEVVRNPAEAGISVPSGVVPTGGTGNGKVHIFADNIADESECFRVIFHELFHLGLSQSVDTPQYNQTMLKFLSDQLVVKYAKEWKQSADGQSRKGKMPVNNFEALAVEESLATIGELLNTDQKGLGSIQLKMWVRRAITALADFAQKIGLVSIAKKLRATTYTEAEKFIQSTILKAKTGAPVLLRDTRFSGKDAQAASQTDTPEFKAWFGDSKVVDADGKPLVVYHGTDANITEFKVSDRGTYGGGIYLTPDIKGANDYAIYRGDKSPTVYPLYVSIKNPATGAEAARVASWKGEENARAELIARGYDGVIDMRSGEIVAFHPEQIKSAIGNNGQFDGNNPDIRFRSATGGGLNSTKELASKANQTVKDLFNAPGSLSWWHKSVGTMNNLANRSPAFKRVFNAVQSFLGDVSFYATDAADMAPTLLPKLESLRDITKSPISAADTKAIAAPIFEGTLTWARDESGKAVPLADLEAKYADLTDADKAGMLLQKRVVTEDQLKRWLASPLDIYTGAVRNRFEQTFLKAGVVFTDAELKSLFNQAPQQIKLYREFRAATDKSLNALGISEMLRYGGQDVEALAQMALDAPTAMDAAELLNEHLQETANEQPDRRALLLDTAATIMEKAEKIQGLIDHGYAPLSRFGHYTVDVLDEDGERAYFGMFESRAEANRMARKMRVNYPNGSISQGTVSEQAYKMFSGITPETLELFGEMVGLEAGGDEAQNQMFQQYLKLAKANRSAMKRLIHRKGIAGFNEDAGRVLAGFVYSNARLTSTNLHTGEITNATADIPKNDGELKDTAIKLADYVRNPQEEAQAVRGVLFAQYLGGSIASAMVNMTQPFAVTMPYLSQWGGAIKSATRMRAALVDAMKKQTGDARLDAALKRAEEEGIVAPQEVHQLMAQARGQGALQTGDGTMVGDLRAKAGNALSKVGLAWGKPFAVAEQFNRRLTFIAAWRTAMAEGIANPAKFAEKAIQETQFIYNKGNKPAWARGAVGSTIFTFKQYSISYVELMHRMATQGGPEGKRAALFALAMLMLLSGAGGLPFVGDAEDVVDGIMQRLGYNWSTKNARRQFLADTLGAGAADFVERGVSGLPGVPIDVAGRFGMGNLIPGTGMLVKKPDHTRDVLEFIGPAGDLAQRAFTGAEQAATGNPVKGAFTMAPKAIENLHKAYDMYQTGMYRDQRGRKVIDVDGYDVLSKAIGFQPVAVAKTQDAVGTQQNMIAQNKMVKAELADDLAQAIFDKDAEKQAAVRDRMRQWNARNPESPVTIDMVGVRRRLRDMHASKAERVARSAPKAIRSDVKRALNEGAP